MPYYFKIRDHEFGPYEERVIISHLIDGEINSRSLIKDGIKGEYKKIEETEFDAVLPSLTARWRYNIGALKREHLFLLISMALSVVPLFSFLGGLYNDKLRLFLLAHNILGWVTVLSLVGFLSTCYFSWMFAYRCYRVIPQSQYNIKPGWRIMLTYVPFFRWGWNFYMWVSLTTKLRRLTNYTMRAGKAAAVFYSTSAIVFSVFFYTVIFCKWSHRILDLSFEQSLWRNIVGGFFLLMLLISFFATLISFIILTFRLKKVALVILRHRYAYNINNNKIKSPFMLSVLQLQRNRDKARRWGHGIGIAGVMIGWPLILIGIPYLVLLIVGSVKYDKVMDDYSKLGYPTTYNNFFKRDEAVDNIVPDLLLWNKANGDLLTVRKLMTHSDFDIISTKNYKDFENIPELNLLLELELAIVKLTRSAINDGEIGEFEECMKYLNQINSYFANENVYNYYQKSLDDITFVLALANEKGVLEKLPTSTLLDYHKFLNRSEFLLGRTFSYFWVLHYLNCIEVFKNDSNELLKSNVELFLYSKSPFIYFSLKDIGEKDLNFTVLARLDYYLIPLKELQNYFDASFLLKQYGDFGDLDYVFVQKSLLMNKVRISEQNIGKLLSQKTNGEFKTSTYKNALNGKVL